MATETGIALLSALRRAGNAAVLRDTPIDFFDEGDERDAYNWLRSHVDEYRTFPSPAVFRQATGIQTVVTQQPTEYYLNEARRRTLYRQLLPEHRHLKDALTDQNPDAYIAKIKDILQQTTRYDRAGSDFVTLEQALADVITDYEEAASSFSLRGITTGFAPLDETTGGYQNDDLISWVGRPGAGKTYIMLKQAYAAWIAGHSVAFSSNELGAVQLARRLFGLHTRINPDLIRKGRLSSTIARNIHEQASAMSSTGVPFNIIVGGFKKSAATVRAVAESLLPDILFVDAAYLLAPEKSRKYSDGRREQVSDTIEDLKRIALSVHRPVVQSVQFNRQAERAPRRGEREGDQRDDNNPVAHLSLAKIAETDVIGMTSSVVVGIEKPDPPYREVRRWIATIKGREGENSLFCINYRFQPVDFSVAFVGPTDPQEHNATDTSSVDLSYMV